MSEFILYVMIPFVVSLTVVGLILFVLVNF